MNAFQKTWKILFPDAYGFADTVPPAPEHQPREGGRVVQAQIEVSMHFRYYWPQAKDESRFAMADLRSGNALVINVSRLAGPEREGYLDFLRGATEYGSGSYRQVDKDAYVFLPSTMSLSDHESVNQQVRQVQDSMGPQHGSRRFFE